MAMKELTATRAELEAYIGKKATTPFYKKTLDKYLINPNKPIWSPVAFFLNAFWLAYRKAFIPSLIVLVAYLSILIAIPFPLSIILFVTILLLMGFFGTNIYLLSVEKEIDKIKKKNNNIRGKKLLELLTERGAPSNQLSFIMVWGIIMILTIILLNRK